MGSDYQHSLLLLDAITNEARTIFNPVPPFVNSAAKIPRGQVPSLEVLEEELQTKKLQILEDQQMLEDYENQNQGQNIPDLTFHRELQETISLTKEFNQIFDNELKAWISSSSIPSLPLGQCIEKLYEAYKQIQKTFQEIEISRVAYTSATNLERVQVLMSPQDLPDLLKMQDNLVILEKALHRRKKHASINRN